MQNDNESHVASCREEVIQHRFQAVPVLIMNELPVRKRKNVFDEYFIPMRHCNERAVTFKRNGGDLYVHTSDESNENCLLQS